MARPEHWALPTLVGLFGLSTLFLGSLTLSAWHRVLWMTMMHKSPTSSLLLALLWSGLFLVVLARSLWTVGRGLWAERHVVLATPEPLEGEGLPPATVVADPRPFAFTWGVFRPRIVISRGLMDLLGREELQAVLWHEEGHARGRDPGRLLLGRTLVQGLFFLPLARFLLDHLRLECELRADAAVLRRGLQVELASALLQLARCSTAASSPLPVAGAMGSLTVRIEQILHPDSPPPAWHPNRFVSLSSLTVLLCTLIGFWLSLCKL